MQNNEKAGVDNAYWKTDSQCFYVQWLYLPSSHDTLNSVSQPDKKYVVVPLVMYVTYQFLQSDVAKNSAF